MKIALVHDWITGMRGGERCLEAFICLYPNADIFTLVHVAGTTTPEIDRRVKGASFLNRLPGIGRYYRALLPLYPAAARSLDLSGYDLVISLSHAAAKNVIVREGVPHICYCFTPMRYIWDQAEHYFPKGTLWAAQPFIESLRRWDRAGAHGVSHFVAISEFVAARIRAFYGRRSHVITPPVRMREEVQALLTPSERTIFESEHESFFLCAGALVPYKRIEVAVQAFTKMKLPLWIAGRGPEERALRKIAGPTVRFLGGVSDAVMWECYRRCRALVFPGIEDFGIVPIECLASGRPVIGVDAGGLRYSLNGMRPWLGSSSDAAEVCGVFVPKRGYGDEAALRSAVESFCVHEAAFQPFVARAQASNFSYYEFFKAWDRFAAQVGIAPGVGVHLTSSPADPGFVSEPHGASC